jgi:type IV secretion/conjugal transfer VirB4 family ATPase
MLNLTEYRKHRTALADYLPWAALVAPGVVLSKDGSFSRTARFRGPDLDSSTEAELTIVTARVNNALKRLGTGWALFVEARRDPAAGYPASGFPEALSWLIDEERQAAFQQTNSHFESSYHLTLVFLPLPESRSRAGRLLFESEQSQSVDWRDQLNAFVNETDRFSALLDSVMPELRWLSDAETLTYFHGSVSTKHHAVNVPEVPCYLDALLADEPLTGGLAPALGETPIRVVSVRGFPTSTWPGTLDELNRLGFSYRWMTRFLCLDKTEAERELNKKRRQWWSKRKGIVTLLRETVFQQESPLVDTDAANKAADADRALQDLGSDSVAYGYITSTIVVTGRDVSEAEDKRKAIERVIQGKGFVTITETLNAIEAWLSSLPCQCYANVRHWMVSTLNLAHLMPLSAVWAGPDRNTHLNGPPLIVTRTDGATPFRLVTHVGDVGHTMIVGPTGAGKSVLTSTMTVQFRRYPGSRVYVFDKGRSARATILGLGGEHYDLGSETGLAFQPLAHIDQMAERAWAADWLASLLAHEGIEITPDVRDALWSALGSLASAPQSERTLTGISVLLQSNRLRQALQPYTLSGPYGRLLDADTDRLGTADVQCFETEELMHARSAGLPVLTYLFHKLESRFDGAPTLLVLAEAWSFLDDPLFAARLREWLKTLRKRNVSVVIDTQALADIQRSSIAPVLIESCPSRIFLPSPQALEPQLRTVYESFGLNARQIELIAHATPKQDYYYQSPLGNRLFDLGLGPLALAFVGASRQEDQRAIDRLVADPGADDFLSAWLKHKGLAWAAALAQRYDLHTGEHP